MYTTSIFFKSFAVCFILIIFLSHVPFQFGYFGIWYSDLLTSTPSLGGMQIILGGWWLGQLLLVTCINIGCHTLHCVLPPWARSHQSVKHILSFTTLSRFLMFSKGVYTLGSLHPSVVLGLLTLMCATRCSIVLKGDQSNHEFVMCGVLANLAVCPLSSVEADLSTKPWLSSLRINNVDVVRKHWNISLNLA